MKAVCAYCGKVFDKTAGHLNRANKLGVPVYCNRECAGLGRRNNKTPEQKKLEKAEYDKKFRKKNAETLKVKRAEAFKIDYAAHPEKYKAQRKRRYPKHLEYLQQPKYKAKKKVYDQKYRAEKNYGEFAEAAIALHQLAGVVDNRKAKVEQSIFNKSQKRKRHASKNTKRKELESCTVGLYQPS